MGAGEGWKAGRSGRRENSDHKGPVGHVQEPRLPEGGGELPGCFQQGKGVLKWAFRGTSPPADGQEN